MQSATIGAEYDKFVESHGAFLPTWVYLDWCLVRCMIERISFNPSWNMH